MTQRDKTARDINRRARLSKGYSVSPLVSYDFASEHYYRKALEKETEVFLTACLSAVEMVYTTVKVGNSSEYDMIKTDRSPSVASVRIIMNRMRTKGLPMFVRNAEYIARRFADKVMAQGRIRAKQSLKKAGLEGLSIKWDAGYDDIYRLLIQKNVELIRNATSQTISNIENIVFDAMTNGQGYKDIKKNLETQRHISKDRIKLITRDQTAKATQSLNFYLQINAGIEYFQWDAVMDERTSTGKGGHRQLDGKIYKYGEEHRYPVIDSYGHRGLPSVRPNCRCRAAAVFIDNGYEAVWDSSSESYIIRKRK